MGNKTCSMKEYSIMSTCVYDRFIRTSLKDFEESDILNIKKVYFQRMRKLKKLLNAGLCTKLQYKLIKELMRGTDIKEILENNKLTPSEFRKNIESLSVSARQYDFTLDVVII